MEFEKIIFLIFFFTSFVSGAVVHYPKVTEEEIESPKEIIRNIREPEKLHTSHSDLNYPAFSFKTTGQQDYLKQRYAEQQQINVEEIARSRLKPISKIYKQTTLEYDQRSEPYDWKPFLSATNQRHERSSNEYIPLVIKKNQVKTNALHATDRKDEASSHVIYVDPRVLKQVLEFKNKQKQIQSRSFTIEKATVIDMNSINDLLAKNPNLHMESIKRIIQEQRQRNKDFPVIEGPQPFHQKDHTPIAEQTVDVLNPNMRPNIHVNHEQEQNPAAESQSHIQETTDPLIASFIPQNGQVVTKEAFEQIQKQLEESSKFQVHDALLRAQQAAQAHVEAQHKAIEQAQRAILENVQQQLEHASPEALRLVQEQIPQFKPQTQTKDVPQALKLVQDNIPQYITHIQPPVHDKPMYPTPLPEQLVSPAHEASTSYSSYKTTSLPEYVPNTITPEKEFVSTSQNLVSQPPNVQNIRIIKITPGTTKVPKHFYIQPQESVSISENVISKQPQLQNIRVIKITPTTTQVPKHIYIHPQMKQKPTVQPPSSTNLEHYAPNHLHQAAAQLQAEKVLLEQVNSQNNAIMKGKKGLTRYVGQKSHDSAGEDKTIDKEAHGSASAYQHIVLEPKERRKFKQLRQQQEVHSDDEHDDLQYAAKYAFGYRIKDNEEGNDFGHEEKRSGRSAEGSYQVLLPDGRRQKVEYYADDSGYHAKVTYENVATHK